MLDTELIKRLGESHQQVYIYLDGIYYPITEIKEDRGVKIIVGKNIVVRTSE